LADFRHLAPDRIQRLLSQVGVDVQGSEDTEAAEVSVAAVPDGEVRRLVRRVLNLFRRTTLLSDTTLGQRLPRDARRVKDEVLPLMVEFGIVTPKLWRGSGKQDAWTIATSLVEIEKADGEPSHRLHPFWIRVDELDR
jgi:hypothetical protein